MKITYYRDGKENTATIKLDNTSDKLKFDDAEKKNTDK